MFDRRRNKLLALSQGARVVIAWARVPSNLAVPHSIRLDGQPTDIDWPCIRVEVKQPDWRDIQDEVESNTQAPLSSQVH
jgi:hypothetical protein